MVRLGFIMACIFMAMPARSHEDPSGEVNPQVEECRGHFCIRFQNNTEWRYYRIEIGLDGAILRKRQAIKESEIPPESEKY